MTWRPRSSDELKPGFNLRRLARYRHARNLYLDARERLKPNRYKTVDALRIRMLVDKWYTAGLIEAVWSATVGFNHDRTLDERRCDTDIQRQLVKEVEKRFFEMIRKTEGH